jgi:hypothetical protein
VRINFGGSRRENAYKTGSPSALHDFRANNKLFFFQGAALFLLWLDTGHVLDWPLQSCPFLFCFNQIYQKMLSSPVHYSILF